MGALETPQDRHGQDSQDGDLQSGTWKGGHGGAGSSRGHGRWSSWPWPHPGHSSRNPSTSPQIFPGASRGYQEPTGARHRNRNRTHSNMTVYRTRQTGQEYPQEQEALLGRARKLRSILAMTWSQGPSQGCLRNRFHLYDRRGRRLGMASVAMTRGATYPQRISVDKTRHDKTGIKTAPVDTTRLKTLRVDRIHCEESAAGWQA